MECKVGKVAGQGNPERVSQALSLHVLEALFERLFLYISSHGLIDIALESSDGSYKANGGYAVDSR